MEDEIFDIEINDDIWEEEKNNTRNIELSELDELPIQAYHRLRRAGLITLGDVMDKSFDEISDIIRNKSHIIKLLSELKNHDVWITTKKQNNTNNAGTVETKDSLQNCQGSIEKNAKHE